jgi:hypothetical protein
MTAVDVPLFRRAELPRGRVDVSEGVAADVVVECQGLKPVATRFDHHDSEDDHHLGSGEDGESTQRVAIPRHPKASEEAAYRSPRGVEVPALVLPRVEKADTGCGNAAHPLAAERRREHVRAEVSESRIRPDKRGSVEHRWSAPVVSRHEHSVRERFPGWDWKPDASATRWRSKRATGAGLTRRRAMIASGGGRNDKKSERGGRQPSFHTAESTAKVRWRRVGQRAGFHQTGPARCSAFGRSLGSRGRERGVSSTKHRRGAALPSP